MLLFWEFYQQQAIRTAEIAAQDAKVRAGDAGDRVTVLEARCERLAMICQALWSFVHEKLGITEQQLLERVKDLDASDGKLDGRVRHPPLDCPKCHRSTPRRMFTCMYCGAPLAGDTFA